MADLNDLSNLTTSVGALSGLMLVNPQSNKGISAQSGPLATPTGDKPKPEQFLFHYEGEQTVSLESDVTNHYVEDNTVVNDHIALRPEMVTTHGFIGELNNVVPKALVPLKIAAEKLGVISAYTPALSTTALLALAEAQFLYQTAASAANSAASVVNAINKKPTQNKQQQAFQKFYAYWQNRMLFTVQTPWAIFPNMVIKNLRAVQDPETNVITDFEITFQRMRFASTQTKEVKILQGRLDAQGASMVDHGTQTPAEAPITHTSAIAGIA